MRSEKQRKTSRPSSSSWDDLPDELWEAIFTHLGLLRHCWLEPVSLVSKRFLTLSNRARTSLTLPSTTNVPHLAVAQLYSRFPLVRTIRLNRTVDVGASITQLAQYSNLPLQSLHLAYQTHFPKDAMRLLGRRMNKTLRSLSCTGFSVMTDGDLSIVADYFPCLQELDINGSGQVTDQGIQAVSTKLKSLLSLNICNQYKLSIRSIECLSTNCPLLSNLVAGFWDNGRFAIEHFLSFASLSSLQLYGVKISESALVQLSGADLKLWKLGLYGPQCSKDVSTATFCGFLKSCRSLRHLELLITLPAGNMEPFDLAASIPCGRLVVVTSPDPVPYSICSKTTQAWKKL